MEFAVQILAAADGAEEADKDLLAADTPFGPVTDTCNFL